MKKLNITLPVFIFSLLAYLVFIIYFVLVKKSGYEDGIYYFAPGYMYLFVKLAMSDIRKIWHVAIFSVLPFAVSVYLSAKGSLPGWEISGFLPIVILSSFLFKDGAQGETPLRNVYVKGIVLIYLAAVIFFSGIHYLRTGNLNSSLYMVISIYSPAPALVVVTMFINFIISTASISIVMNDLKFFNNGAKIKRLIFDTDNFLTFPHFNLFGIETAAGVDKKDFLAKVEALNVAAQNDENYNDILKKDKLFSSTMEDGATLTMAPLKVMKADKTYSFKDMKMPEEKENLSYVVLAENKNVIGYYAVDRISPSTNASILDVFKKQYGVETIVTEPSQPKMWKDSARIAGSVKEVLPDENDIIITERNLNTKAASLFWRGDPSQGSLFMVKPFLSTFLHLIVISSKVKDKIFKGVILSSLPFSVNLFLVSFGLHVPQVSAVTLMLSFFITVMYIFYVGKKK